MKCPYCAETIQEEAILCRFCGARRSEDAWTAPSYAQPRAAAGEVAHAPSSNFTIASSGWLLMLSAVLSLVSVASPVPFAGDVHGGAIAILYNLTFTALFAAMGYALAYRKPWAIPVTAATTAMYTFEKLVTIFDEKAGQAALGGLGATLGELGPDVAPMVRMALVLTAATVLVLWWAFVVYLYFKRDYFKVPPETKALEQT